MEKHIKNYSELCEETERFLVSKGYSRGTIQAHKACWYRIGLFLEEKGKSDYSAIGGLEFLHNEIDYPEVIKSCPVSAANRAMIRAVRILDEFSEFQRVPSMLKSGSTGCNDDVQSVYDSFHEYREICR